jgi:hypothetical protein
MSWGHSSTCCLKGIFGCMQEDGTRQAMYVWCNTGARSCTHCCSGKSVLHILSVFVHSGTQHAMRMRHIDICGLPDSTVFSPHYLINGTIKKKKVMEHKMCASIFNTIFVWNNSRYEKNWERYGPKCIFGLHPEYPLFLSGWNETWNFSTDVWNKLKYQISWKCVLWEPSCSMRANGGTDT